MSDKNSPWGKKNLMSRSRCKYIVDSYKLDSGGSGLDKLYYTKNGSWEICFESKGNNDNSVYTYYFM